MTDKGEFKEKLREAVANLCHEQWSGWMRYLFSKGTFNDDGTWTMPAWAVQRWTRQMETPYPELSNEEQDSDRAEADKFLALTEGATVVFSIQGATLRFDLDTSKTSFDEAISLLTKQGGVGNDG